MSFVGQGVLLILLNASFTAASRAMADVRRVGIVGFTALIVNRPKSGRA